MGERVVFREGDQPVSEGTRCDHYSPAEDDRTRQSDRDSSDINITIKKYNLQPSDFGLLEAGWSGRPLGVYADLSELPTFGALLDTVNRARDAFMKLPPEVRAYFGNSPAVLLDRWNAGEDSEIFKELGWIALEPSEEAKTLEARKARVMEIAEGVRAGQVEAKP